MSEPEAKDINGKKLKKGDKVVGAGRNQTVYTISAIYMHTNGVRLGLNSPTGGYTTAAHGKVRKQ